jgi:chemotaxis protein MotB
MSEDTARPIIVVKKKKNAAGHHGGAWKVAYADFVTAMMAFFMVMWLVASLNKEQRSAMFQYFNNPSMEQGHSTKAAPGQAGPGGASTSVIKLGGGLDAPKVVIDTHKPARPPDIVADRPTTAEAKEKERKEKEQLESLLEELKRPLPWARPWSPSRTSCYSTSRRRACESRSSTSKTVRCSTPAAPPSKITRRKFSQEVAKYLNGVPNRISLSGHTDAKPYPGTTKLYSNWELSADRANAARRALIAGGLDEKRLHASWVLPPRYCSTRTSRSIQSIVASASSS